MYGHGTTAGDGKRHSQVQALAQVALAGRPVEVSEVLEAGAVDAALSNAAEGKHVVFCGCQAGVQNVAINLVATPCRGIRR